ncbi:MAG: D12 class N6 adenine-specific DNA methyltransferase [Candidatus Scalindua rubra]|uniref:D12 class N6 adenine-specific DNA methyltransferase n=1 Tax=Candidatus Scalindua rubra TaxID=1872076 RepID=A0A1E3X431_9BACT|nr:MAG: D12 class N6 adenine-specific DNA methyltransferase [Candidatus Scalindua rubra]
MGKAIEEKILRERKAKTNKFFCLNYGILGAHTYGICLDFEELHNYRYLGDTFRERERIKLKSERWIRRLKTIPVLERQALLSAISDLDRTRAKNLSQECL